MTTNDTTWPFQSRDVHQDKPDPSDLYTLIDKYFSDEPQVASKVTNMINEYFSDKPVITQEEIKQIDMEATNYEEVGYSDFFAIANELFGSQRANQYTDIDYNEWLTYTQTF